MKNEEFYESLEDAMREPLLRRRGRKSAGKEEEHAEINLKKSGKRSHRRPTHKDSFWDEYFSASV